MLAPAGRPSLIADRHDGPTGFMAVVLVRPHEAKPIAQ